MPIAAPRRRLVEAVPVLFVTRRQRFDRRRADRRLPLTSMIDVLVVIVFFLLTMFRAPSECGCGIPVDLPRAANTLDLVEAPVVVVRDTDVTVDAAPAGRAPASDGAEGIERIDELFIVLKSKRELWKSTHPSRAF